MPDADFFNSSSRRSTMLGIGALVGAAGLSAKATPTEVNPDAELITACDRYLAVEQELERKYGHEDIGEEPLLDELGALIEKMRKLRATTLAGHMARVRALKILCPFVFKFSDRGSEEEQMIGAVLRDLLPEEQS